VIEGKNLEKMINMAVSRGLCLWDVKWVGPGKASAKIRLNGIRALRHICRRTRCRFTIKGRGGIPFRVARIKKRKVLLAGAVLSVFLVYMMSSFIWFVEVRGSKEIPAEKILLAAENAGLAMGTFKPGLDKDRIEKYIRNEITEISFVGIRITGTKAIIDVAEKVIIPPLDNSPANVVAEKDGLVQEILVLAGKQAVNEGDMVRKGDILITGVIRPEPMAGEEQDPEKPDDSKPPDPVKFVRAKGLVRAKVWYDGYGESRLVETGTKRTGKRTEVLSIRVMGRELVIKGPRKQPYREYVTETKVKKAPVWRNLRIPVEIVTTNHYEVETYRDIIGISEAKALARERALADARAKVPEDTRLLKEFSEEIPARGSNVIRVKEVLEVLEDIGVEQPLDHDAPITHN